jgi:hypothetical protein
MYLEIISANPDAVSPRHSRWFDLDKLDADSTPRIMTWVARTYSIYSALAVSPITLGNITPMKRGVYEWLITIPTDGNLPMQGIAPSLIQWQRETHPAHTLSDSGCSLIRLEGHHHEADRITRMLELLDFEGEFSVSQLSAYDSPYLVAFIKTPEGIVTLDSRS